MQGRATSVTRTGAGAGRATALRYSQEGGRIVVAEINAPAGEGTAATIRLGGGEAVFVSTDISKTAGVKAMRALLAARAALGRLGTAEEVTDVAVFLTSDESRYCTGGFCMVDGGMTVL